VFEMEELIATAEQNASSLEIDVENPDLNYSTLSATTPSKKRKSYSSYTVSDKIEIVKEFKSSSMTLSDFAEAKGIPRSTMQDWIKSDAKGGLFLVPKSDIRKRIRFSEYKDIEDRLVQFIVEQRNTYLENLRQQTTMPSNSSSDNAATATVESSTVDAEKGAAAAPIAPAPAVGLSYVLLKQKAMEYAKELLPDEGKDFKASTGWIAGVFRRNGIDGLRFLDQALSQGFNDLDLTADYGQASFEDMERTSTSAIGAAIGVNDSSSNESSPVVSPVKTATRKKVSIAKAAKSTSSAPSNKAANLVISGAGPEELFLETSQTLTSILLHSILSPSNPTSTFLSSKTRQLAVEFAASLEDDRRKLLSTREQRTSNATSTSSSSSAANATATASDAATITSSTAASTTISANMNESSSSDNGGKANVPAGNAATATEEPNKNTKQLKRANAGRR
jgi:hypothetical protein